MSTDTTRHDSCSLPNLFISRYDTPVLIYLIKLRQAILSTQFEEFEKGQSISQAARPSLNPYRTSPR